MGYASKVLALSCVVTVLTSGLGFALPTAAGQEQSPAEVIPGDTEPAPSPDASADASADADAGTDADADTGTGTQN